MKHLIICREYPPAPSGGIGTYVHHISRLLAENGETVHVIGQIWEKAEKTIEEECNGKLIIHRIPFETWTAFLGPRPSSLIRSKTVRALYASDFPPQCFSWQASLLAERLVESEGIDLIEGQDYEAPLYYFQLRRAQGLGPERQPPCFVHLHSPTQLIGRYNEWNLALPRLQMAKQLEDYSTLASDSWLCPSRFFAGQAEVQHGFAAGSVEVIPYPLGDTAQIERDQDTWSNGSICYVGRLEKRKGAVEWIHAAVAIADKYPSVRFEFIGANVLGANRILSEGLLDQMIPRRLKEKFIFRGAVHRSAIPQFLKRARIAVVPSRWDNFPNTCIEAMASGLPVIATREGGMVEMIADGRNGWLADAAKTQHLEAALTRALDTSPVKIAEMGQDAARSIREVCGNQRIVEKHLSFRRSLVKRGAKGPIKPCSSSQSLGSSALASGNGRQETLQEQLATLKYLVSNPKMTLRVLRQAAAKLARRA